MIRSMTGFGKAACQLSSGNVNIEIRTLNSKSLDINLKLPTLFKENEQLFRSRITQVLTRGKVELTIGLENHDTSMTGTLNKPIMESYYKELSDFAMEMNGKIPEDLISSILRLPDVFRQAQLEYTEDDWHVILNGFEDALMQVDAFRLSEGAHLEKEVSQRIGLLSDLLLEIKPLLGQRANAIREKILKGLEEISQVSATDPNRFEQEMIYYLEKLDITEEMVRLDKHLAYFRESMEEKGPPGKKLGFITQELGREINTIGSKANDAAIQKIVVRMKDELEKIKEQLMNIL